MMPLRPSFLALCLALAATAAARADDWPTYRHDNRRSGATSEPLAFPLELRWTHDGGTPRQAWSGPAKWDAYSGNSDLQSMRNFDPCYYVTASGGLVYYGSSRDNALHALEAASGAERWVFFAEAPVRLPPTVADGRAFAGADDGCFYALDARGGELLWKTRGAPVDRRIPSNAGLISLWPVRTSALLAGGRLYGAASLTPWESSWLLALDPLTGDVLERRELGSVTLQGPLLATSQDLVAPQGRSAPLLFSADTLDPKGAIGHAGGVFCLVTEDDQVIAGPNSQKPTASQLLLTDRDGRKVATFNDTSRAAIAGGTAYLHNRGRLKAVHPGDAAAELWSIATPVPSELVLCANAVLLGLDGAVAAYARDDGELLWQASLPGSVHGLAVAGGRLFASTDLGAIHAFGP